MDAYEATLDVVTRTRRSTLRASSGWAFAGFALLIAGQAGAWLSMGAGTVAILTSIAVFVFALSRRLRPGPMQTVTEPRRVRITPAGIEMGGPLLSVGWFSPEVRILADSIAGAYYQPSAEKRVSVRCVGHAGDVLFEAEVDGEEQARAVLSVLGRSIERRRGQFDVDSPVNATATRQALGLTTLFLLPVLTMVLANKASFDTALTVALTVLSTLLAALPVSTPAKIEVGADGVLLQWLGTERFVGYETIEAAEVSGNGVRLTLRDGASVFFPGPPRRRDSDNEHAVRAIVARIDDALKSHRAGQSARELADRVRRRDRAVDEWSADLRRLREGDANYRSPATREEDLWHVVEDASAPEDARVGAALVLRSSAEAEPRIRIAAEAVASPRLRVALETVADPAADDAALEEALARVES